MAYTLMWNIKFHTLFRISMYTQTLCAMRACMYAYKYTRTKMFTQQFATSLHALKHQPGRSQLLYHLSIQAKQWHVDHAQLRMPADTLSS